MWNVLYHHHIYFSWFFLARVNAVCLITKVTTDETVIQDKLAADLLLEERTQIPIDNLMEILAFWEEKNNFRMEFNAYRQEGLAMDSLQSPVLANIYMVYFEKMAFVSTSLTPYMLFRYVDGAFILWPHQEDV